ncbi:hypothetical protein [Neoroseomonas eburnea]|uniref:hypothetical protein n=1 Tax=Neoroseomonas eburnea TaxID=1346889 RepID=UPI001FE50C38|nr:hypothetical protein [Neoroseomonas eburnea]
MPSSRQAAALRPSGWADVGSTETSSSQTDWPAIRWLRFTATMTRSGMVKAVRLVSTISSSRVVPVEMVTVPSATASAMPLPLAATSQRAGLISVPLKLSRNFFCMLLILSMSSVQS